MTRYAPGGGCATGSNPGSKLSATEPNSEQLEPALTAESAPVQPEPSGWGPGGRRFKSCLPDLNSLQMAKKQIAVDHRGVRVGVQILQRTCVTEIAP